MAYRLGLSMIYYLRYSGSVSSPKLNKACDLTRKKFLLHLLGEDTDRARARVVVG